MAVTFISINMLMDVQSAGHRLIASLLASVCDLTQTTTLATKCSRLFHVIRGALDLSWHSFRFLASFRLTFSTHKASTIKPLILHSFCDSILKGYF